MDVSTWTLPPAAVSRAPSACVITAVGADPALLWSTAGLPVVIPWRAFTPAMQADFALLPGLLPSSWRVSALLADERRQAAFAIASSSAQPLSSQAGLELILATWAAREQARLGLPATRAAVLVVGDDVRGSRTADIRGALEDVRSVLAPLPWPRWAGPVVVFCDQAERGIPSQGVVRPALPLLQLAPAEGLRARAASSLARLAMELSVPPSGGWPGWLSNGVAEVARAKAAGEGPSPRVMRERRQAAGPEAIAAMLLATPLQADVALSGALVQPLLTPDGQAHFASLLDLLRQGASSAGALRIAYGITPARWQ
jgi:hypothetical protein